MVTPDTNSPRHRAQPRLMVCAEEDVTPLPHFAIPEGWSEFNHAAFLSVRANEPAAHWQTRSNWRLCSGRPVRRHRVHSA